MPDSDSRDVDDGPGRTAGECADRDAELAHADCWLPAREVRPAHRGILSLPGRAAMGCFADGSWQGRGVMPVVRTDLAAMHVPGPRSGWVPARRAPRHHSERLPSSRPLPAGR
jgi:hypothetical protein